MIEHAYVRIRVAILFVEDIFPPTSRAISRPPIMQHVERSGQDAGELWGEIASAEEQADEDVL